MERDRQRQTLELEGTESEAPSSQQGRSLPVVSRRAFSACAMSHHTLGEELPRALGRELGHESACVFRHVVEYSDLGIMLGSRQGGDYVYVNASAARLLQRLPHALSLKRLLAADSGDLDGEFGRTQSSSASLRMIVQEGGRAVALSMCTSELNDDLVVVQLRDVTEDGYFRRGSSGVSDTRTVVRIFNQLRHEIGNPLNSIKMTLQVLKENIEDFSKAKTLSYIARSINEVARLERLLASLREFGRENVLEPQELDLKGYLNRFAELAAPQCSGANMRLVVTVAEEARFIIADGAALEQVLHNLVLNAMQARRGQTGTITITTRPGQRSDRTIIDVEDDGVGIPHRSLPMIFKPMFTTKREGTGLGLALVERLVNAMRGHVSVQSEPQRFTRFSVTLPAGEQP